MNYITMNLEELKKMESEWINIKKFSDERMKQLFETQLELAQKMTEEKKINDELRERLMKISTTIEMYEETSSSKGEP